MNPRKVLLEEAFDRVGDTISKHIISEKVHQFTKYGNLFLFFEVMNLRKEFRKIEEEIQSIKDIMESRRVRLTRI